MKQVLRERRLREAMGERERERERVTLRKEEEKEANEKRIQREKEEGTRRERLLDSPRAKMRGRRNTRLSRVRGPTITGHQSRESPASRRESATAP